MPFEEIERENEEEYKVFNDSVHGHIQMHPLYVKIIDTPEFQRLRNIKQLGTTYFVYPGGSHNRFEHCLGVCYLAGEMVDELKKKQPSLKIEETDKLCVQIAGLCHDLGHGPFSHLWEDFLRKKGEKWRHEESSVALFHHLIESNQLEGDFEKHGLDESKRNFIAELILGKGNSCDESKKFLFQIVCNEMNSIDVDKWDYFLRDGLHLNLKISFDYKRLLKFCKVIEIEEKGKKMRKQICFKNKEAYNIYEMFLVRSSLHYKAYQHRVSLVIHRMIVDALLAADQEYSIKLDGNSECKLSEAHRNPLVWSKMTDNIFYELLWSHSNGLEITRNILKRILKRKLYKFIESVNLLPKDTFIENNPDWANRLTKGVEKDLNAKLNCDDFIVFMSNFYLGSKNSNPFEEVYFYDKDDSSKAYKIDWKKIPLFPVHPDSVLHHVELFLFCKNEESINVSMEEVKTTFHQLVKSAMPEEVQNGF